MEPITKIILASLALRAAGPSVARWLGFGRDPDIAMQEAAQKQQAAQMEVQREMSNMMRDWQEEDMTVAREAAEQNFARQMAMMMLEGTRGGGPAAAALAQPPFAGGVSPAAGGLQGAARQMIGA